jgi:hypothetical protein
MSCFACYIATSHNYYSIIDKVNFQCRLFRQNGDVCLGIIFEVRWTSILGNYIDTRRYNSDIGLHAG